MGNVRDRHRGAGGGGGWKLGLSIRELGDDLHGRGRGVLERAAVICRLSGAESH